MKTSQKALTPAERRRRHWLMSAPTSELSSFLHSTNSLCVSSARRHWNKMSHVRLFTGFVGNATAVVSWVDSVIRPPNFFYKTSSAVNKIMLKILWLFFVDTMNYYTCVRNISSTVSKLRLLHKSKKRIRSLVLSAGTHSHSFCVINLIK